MSNSALKFGFRRVFAGAVFAFQAPAPITSTSYNIRGTGPITHTLMGLVPGGRYSVTLTNGVIQVNQNASGDKTASVAGVLYFVLRLDWGGSSCGSAGLAGGADG